MLLQYLSRIYAEKSMLDIFFTQFNIMFIKHLRFLTCWQYTHYWSSNTALKCLLLCTTFYYDSHTVGGQRNNSFLWKLQFRALALTVS